MQQFLESKGLSHPRGGKKNYLERVKQIYRVLYRGGLNRSQALEKLRTHANADTAEFKLMLDFAEKSERGIAPGGT